MTKSYIPYLILLIAILCACNNQKPKQAKEESSCFEYMNLEQNDHFCDTTLLSNGAKLYYLWNCDSTCLVFENDKKVILKSCDDLDPIICTRIGMNFLKEYPNYLLFSYDWFSGCCDPPDLVFLNKETGSEVKRVSKGLFVWGDVDENYALYFKDTTLTELIYLDHSTDKEKKLEFKRNELRSAIKTNNVMYVAQLFKNFKKNKTNLDFEFELTDKRVEQKEIKLE